MAFESLTPISEADAAEILHRNPVPDPTGQATPESMAATGQAFELKAEGGAGTFIVRKNGLQLWVEAGVGRAADDLTAMGLQLIEEIARQSGCTEVAFQTARPGLVRKSASMGYDTCGWIQKKRVSQ